MPDKITIELSIEEAEVFRWFRKYQDIWEKTFQIRGGNITLHFDESGKLREVEYRYKNKIIRDRA